MSREAILRIVETEPLSKCLRKAAYAAQESRARDLERWVRLELGGYLASNPAMAEGIVVPEYRTVVGQHTDLFGRVFVVPADLSFINETRLRNGVEELEALAASRDTVIIHDAQMCELIREHLKVDVYSFRFSAIHLKGILSAIRTELEVQLRQLRLPDLSGEAGSEGQTEEIVQLRPSFHGIAVDLRALWRRLRGPT